MEYFLVFQCYPPLFFHCGGADLRHLPIYVYVLGCSVFISSKKIVSVCLLELLSFFLGLLFFFVFAMCNYVSLSYRYLFFDWVILFVFIHYHRCYHLHVVGLSFVTFFFVALNAVLILSDIYHFISKRVVVSSIALEWVASWIRVPMR